MRRGHPEGSLSTGAPLAGFRSPGASANLEPTTYANSVSLRILPDVKKMAEFWLGAEKTAGDFARRPAVVQEGRGGVRDTPVT